MVSIFRSYCLFDPINMTTVHVYLNLEFLYIVLLICLFVDMLDFESNKAFR